MDRLLNGIGDYAAAYLDDLVIYSDDWEKHLLHLRAVLQRLHEAGLTAKCQLGANQYVYLGHTVRNGEIRPDMTKIEAVENFPQPKTKKEVRAFLGLSGYYRRFNPKLWCCCFTVDRSDEEISPQHCHMDTSL